MARSTNQKFKLLYLAQILERESDEEHPMSVGELIAALERCGIAAERKSIYGDIEALAHFGMDIVTMRRRGNCYYLGERSFQLPELKLLVDAVQSAKFISSGKSQSLIKKLCALASRHEAALMQRQVHVQGRTKTLSERTYYNVDAIQNAIAANRQIRFYYFEWVVDPAAPKLYARRRRRAGEAYRVSPWTLLWDDEYYYLVAYDEAAAMMKHYRVDKMDEIDLCAEARLGAELFQTLDIGEYSKEVFGMFGGQEAEVELRFANSLIGVVLDRYGSDIIIQKSGDEHFIVTVRAIVSPQFLSWLFGFGNGVQVLSPAPLVARIKAEVAAIAALYAPGAAPDGGKAGDLPICE